MGDHRQQKYAKVSYGYKEKSTFTLYDVPEKNGKINF